MELIEKVKEKAKGYVQEKIDNIPKPEASMEGLSFKGVGWDGVSYNVKVGIMNPYPHSIPLCDVAYILKSDGRVILSGNMPDPGDLEGKHQTTTLDVGLKVPHSAVVSLVRDIFADWDIDYELEVILTIEVPIIGKFDIHLTQTGEVKLPTISSFWNGSSGDNAEEKDKDKDKDDKGKGSDTKEDDKDDKEEKKDRKKDEGEDEKGGGINIPIISSLLSRSESDVERNKDKDKDEGDDEEKKNKKKDKDKDKDEGEEGGFKISITRSKDSDDEDDEEKKRKKEKKKEKEKEKKKEKEKRKDEDEGKDD